VRLNRREVELSILKKNSLAIAILVSFSIAIVVTITITIWEWLENPSGIFHGQNGTNWTFIYETASSWFVPTFINATVITVLIHLAFRGMLWLRMRRRE
jgi:hypothetical protein